MLIFSTVNYFVTGFFLFIHFYLKYKQPTIILLTWNLVYNLQINLIYSCDDFNVEMHTLSVQFGKLNLRESFTIQKHKYANLLQNYVTISLIKIVERQQFAKCVMYSVSQSVRSLITIKRKDNALLMWLRWYILYTSICIAHVIQR